MKNPFRKKTPSPQETFVRTYLDSIAPGVVKFEVDHYIFGNTYRCVWALREYPASTESQAILRHLGEKSGVTLRIYCRQVSPGEEDRIIDNANKKNKLDRSDPNKLRQAVEAESNLRDVAELVHRMHREHEPLLHCAVYLEMTADSMEHLRQLQTDVLTELVRCKLNVDKLLLRQKQGFYCASPVGYNALGREFERVLPAGSVANLYPFNYSGKTDPNGFYIGKDKYGSNIVVDFDRRDSDKTSANILILGNSGQGKSYLMKLLICNLLEAGKFVISLDAEHELEELCGNLNGCFVDLMAGEKRINVLEVRCWNEDTEADESAPGAFRKSTLLARHISFLKDFFRAYKDFSDAHIDTIEIMLSKLYGKWGITERTNFRRMRSEDYPILSDLYDTIQEAYDKIDPALLEVIRKALVNIRKYHEKQIQNSWFTSETNGTMLGQKVTPLNRVGVYVPGGKAVYPSSVLMNIVPAKVAGVPNIVMTTPPGKDGKICASTLVAAKEAGADEIYKVGGAQAIGALAFGTESIPKVDKIVGPGNIFVALAKKAVYGYVSIDSIAGPSEILVLADETANPHFVAADLLSQAEHDELACAILITTSREFADKVDEEVKGFVEVLSRKEIIQKSLDNFGYILIAEDMEEAIEAANEIAPEHMEIVTANPFEDMMKVKNAGAIFIGEYSSEPLGDYFAGPNHVLPTNGTAKFFSALSVDDFIKKSSIVYYSRAALRDIHKDIIQFATSEQLTAHANSIAVRFEDEDKEEK